MGYAVGTALPEQKEQMMAEAASRASAKTTLKWGTIEAPVALFKTTADPGKVAVFEQGGPNGGRLVTRAAPAPTPAADAGAEQPDPLALDPGPEADAPLFDQEAVTQEKIASAAIGSTPVPLVPVLVEEGTEQIVERADIRKGVWRPVAWDEEGKPTDSVFMDTTDALKHIEEITALEVMEIQGAIDIGRVPRERVTGSYYVGVDGQGVAKVLVLLCQAMVATRRALVVKWTKTSRQATGVIVPSRRNGMPAIVLLQLCWPEDWRKAPPRADLAGTREMATAAEFSAATELVRAMADSSVLLEEQRDDALALREQLHMLALNDRLGELPKVVPAATEPMPPLLAQLEASLAAV